MAPCLDVALRALLLPSPTPSSPLVEHVAPPLLPVLVVRGLSRRVLLAVPQPLELAEVKPEADPLLPPRSPLC